MLRATLLLMQSIWGTALFIAAISVYLFHDVDKDEIGHLNRAFAGLCAEAFWFTVIIGAGVAVLTLSGRSLFHLRGYSPRSKLVLFLGVGVAVFQYVWDLAGRVAFPKFADFSLSAFLIFAIVFCSAFIVRDTFRQMKLCQAVERADVSLLNTE